MQSDIRGAYAPRVWFPAPLPENPSKLMLTSKFFYFPRLMLSRGGSNGYEKMMTYPE